MGVASVAALEAGGGVCCSPLLLLIGDMVVCFYDNYFFMIVSRLFQQMQCCGNKRGLRTNDKIMTFQISDAQFDGVEF